MLNRCRLAFTRGMKTSAVSRTTGSKSNVPAADNVIKELDSLPTPEKFKVGPLEEVPKFPSMPKYKLKSFEKVYLVWSGHYKSIRDVPSRVDNDVMHKARTYARIRINLIILGLGVCTCVFCAWLGKMAAKDGQFIERRNLEWHQKINAEHKKEQAEKEVAASGN